MSITFCLDVTVKPFLCSLEQFLYTFSVKPYANFELNTKLSCIEIYAHLLLQKCASFPTASKASIIKH